MKEVCGIESSTVQSCFCSFTHCNTTSLRCDRVFARGRTSPLLRKILSRPSTSRVVFPRSPEPAPLHPRYHPGAVMLSPHSLLSCWFQDIRKIFLRPEQTLPSMSYTPSVRACCVGCRLFGTLLQREAFIPAIEWRVPGQVGRIFWLGQPSPPSRLVFGLVDKIHKIA